MPLYALVGGQRQRALRDGPRRASCAECGALMRARTGSVRIWHWAHVAANPHCEAARETAWHLAWKVLGLDGTQEVTVGSRRADVLAPGGFALEFQATALGVDEVRAREADWAAQGGMAWVFRADRQAAAGYIEIRGAFDGDEDLVKPENRATLEVTWRWAPEQIRAARAASFLDIGDDELVFVGGWYPESSPLAGYGWKVSKDWVVRNVLHGSTIPAPLAAHPSGVRRKIEAWQRRRGEAARLAAWRLEALQRAESERASERAPTLMNAALRLDPAEVLREMEALLEGGIRGLPGSWTWELWPLRDDLSAVRAVWAAAVRASGGVPALAAVRRARQEYEQQMHNRRQC
jgi:hypothetical protein